MPAKRTTRSKPGNVVKQMGGTKGALKKTTAKGAYAKNRKSNFQKRRAPMVETKSRVHNELSSATDIADPLSYQDIQNDDAYTFLPLTSFTSMDQGFLEDQMVGNSIYCRYLKAKFEFTLPSGKNAIKHPCDVYLVHGWVTASSALTNSTVPQAQTLSRAGYDNLTLRVIKDYFNDDSDKLRFIPKATTNMKILGYRKFKINKNTQLGATIDLATDTGALPLIHMNCNYTVNRKIHYQQGLPVNNSAALHDQHMYPNESWRPFVVVYNPSFAQYNAAGADDPAKRIRVRYNDATWFSDS